MVRATRVLLLPAIALVLTACGGGGSGDPTAPAQGGNNPPPAGGSNSAPVISGSPATAVTAGSAYNFTPSASDADNDSLTFSITNKPSWATFSTQNGNLSGTPTSSNVGTTANVTITVSDGKTSTSMTPFSIAVNSAPPASTGTVTLDWTPPTQNTDQSALTVAGYHITYGKSLSSMNQTINVGSGLTSYVIDNLAAATWYFSISAYNASGGESVPSNPVSVSIQ
jgi:hypothetical protein